MDWQQLREKGLVTERPFTSHAPLIGALIVWFRTQWSHVAARWYVRPLLAQQNEFNQQTVKVLETQAGHIDEQVMQAAEQDRQTTRLLRQTAEITLQVRQMNRTLAAFDSRLTKLENNK